MNRIAVRSSTEVRRRVQAALVLPVISASQRIQRHPRIGIGLVFALLMSVHIWSLMRVPAPFVDEAWTAARTWNLIQNGKNFSSLDMGILDHYPGYWTFFPILHSWFQSIALRIVGTPDLFALRLVSLVFGLWLLLALYIIGKELGGKRLAILSMVLVGLSRPFFYSAHLARYDVETSAFGFTALALYVTHRASRPMLHFLSGFLVALSMEIHLFGAIYAFPLLALYIFDHHLHFFRNRLFWSAILGGTLGSSVYLFLHILPYSQTFIIFNQLLFTATRMPPILTGKPSIIFNGIVNFLSSLPSNYLAISFLIFWGSIRLWQSKMPSDKTILLLSGSLMLAYVLLIPNQLPYYQILIAPALILLVASFLLSLRSKASEVRMQLDLPYALAWSMTLGSVIALLFSLQQNWYPAYVKVQTRIDQSIQPGETIIGPQTYWFGLIDHTYYSWEELKYYQHSRPGSGLEEALAALRPDIFIVDGDLDSFISDQPSQDPYVEYLRLPLTELDALLAQRATLLTSFDATPYGEVRIYRLWWDR